MNKEDVSVPDTEFQGFHLSPQQRRLWPLQKIESNSPYRIRGSVLLEGEVNPKTLKEAVHQTVIWHEVLRTTVRRMPGMEFPVQVIHDEPAYEFTVHDLSHLSVADRKAAVSTLWEETAAPAFDLTNGPLLKVSLLTLARGEHQLHLCLPALCTDEAGLAVLVKEIAHAYTMLTSDEQVERAALQYADISEVLNDLLESEETGAGRAYWSQQDVASSAEVSLPFEDYPDSGQSFTPQSLSLMFDPDLGHAVHRFARTNNVTPSILLQTCWHILLWKLAAEEITVGTGFSGRMYEGLDAVPGLFVRYLPIVVNQQKDQEITEVLDQVRQAVAAADEHQDYFDSVRIARRHSQQSERPFFFPVSFEFVESTPAFQTAGITWTLQTQESCTDRFVLKLRCVASAAKGLETQFHYDGERFATRTVELVARSYHTLIANILRKTILDELIVLDDEQQRELLVKFNDTARSFGPPSCLHEAIEKQCERTPDHVAVSFQQQRLTYGELDVKTNQLARRLRQQGIGPETLVCVLLERSIEMSVALVAVLKAGAAYLPLDPEQPPERLRRMIDDGQPKVLLTQEKFLPLVTAVGAESVEVICLDRDWASIATEPITRIESDAVPANVAYVIYTSGSTGQPKGVAITHEAISNRLLWMQERFPLNESDRVLQKTVYSFDASVWELFLPLMTGARVVLAAPGAHRDSAALVAAIKDESVTILQMVPSMLAVLVEESGIRECGSLRRVFSGGEALPESLQERFYERVSGAELINLYGPTEASIDASYCPCERGR
ncbi:MAG TPA: AMP-binding protein, partial [Pyrinomonadaceae bacterium]|nr:AMP-binding protein [Pyrinomonadaceae bacterium]